MDGNKISTFDLPTVFERPIKPSGGRKRNKQIERFPHIVSVKVNLHITA